MKKTLVIIAAAVVVLSSTLAFHPKNEDQIVQKEQKVASVEKSGGYALQDKDQW
jgi:protein involved in sex pheromone biosynthesis